MCVCVCMLLCAVRSAQAVFSFCSHTLSPSLTSSLSAVAKTKAPAAKAPAAKGKSVPTKKAEAKEVPLFAKNPKNFGIGQDIQPKRDVGRFVKWPKYVRLQRQKRVLYQRLKVPPSIHQFTQTLDKGTAQSLFKILHKFRPEDKAQKKARLGAAAAAKAASDKVEAGPKPISVKFGLNHVTSLIEQKKAQLVVIAHDVEPIEVRSSFSLSPFLDHPHAHYLRAEWAVCVCISSVRVIPRPGIPCPAAMLVARCHSPTPGLRDSSFFSSPLARCAFPLLRG